VDYLARQAIEQPVAFLALVGKLMPKAREVTHDLGPNLMDQLRQAQQRRIAMASQAIASQAIDSQGLSGLLPAIPTPLPRETLAGSDTPPPPQKNCVISPDATQGNCGESSPLGEIGEPGSAEVEDVAQVVMGVVSGG
jgi:hypothetical protein